MKQRAKRLVATVASPAARLLNRGRPRVLMYHRFGHEGDFRRLHVAAFEQQLIYIKRHFHPLRLRELATALKSGERLPANSVVLTIDDGYADFCRLAVPILERHQIPATVFAVSDFIGRDVWLWWDAIHYLLHAVKAGRVCVEVAGRMEIAALATAEDRDTLWERLADDIFPLPMRVKWERIDRLQRDLQTTLPSLPTAAYEAATWQELRGLDTSLFEIGAHTKTHAILSQCEPSELRVELEESKQILEARLDREVSSFCYPNGQKNDYNDDCVTAVKRAGYQCAVVVNNALLDAGTNPFTIGRLSPSSLPDVFGHQLNGVPELRRAVAASVAKLFSLSPNGSRKPREC